MKFLFIALLFTQLFTCQRDDCHDSDCNDNNPCTVDRCIAGTCVNALKICEDGLPTTDNFCDQNTGECKFRGFIPDDICNDHNPCTVDSFFNNACNHYPVNCSDQSPCTRDICILKDGNCQHLDTCANGCSFDTIIDPAYNEYCKVIVCHNGQPTNTVRSCDDGNPCTNDVCYSEQCHHPEINCDDGTDCVNRGTCYCLNGNCIYL